MRLPASFKVSVRLVLVRAVVRDSKGHTIGTLGKDDFQVYDNGKPQVIKNFAVEQPIGTVTTTPEPAKTRPLRPPLPFLRRKFPTASSSTFLTTCIWQFKDLLPARAAAERHMATFRPTDRAAVFATSGQGNIDFTDDRAKLHEALMHIQPRPILNLGVAQCPYMTYYMADQIANMHDDQVLAVAAQDAVTCGGSVRPSGRFAAALQSSGAQQASSMPPSRP